MTDLDLDAIEARANAATPGPWKWSKDRDYLHMELGGPGYLAGAYPEINFVMDDGSAAGEYESKIEADSPNGIFIAASRTDIPALVARCRELEDKIEKYKLLLSELYSYVDYGRKLRPIKDEIKQILDTGEPSLIYTLFRKQQEATP